MALTRKNALFAGHEVGAGNWALLTSIVATCKLNDVNPVDYIADPPCGRSSTVTPRSVGIRCPLPSPCSRCTPRAGTRQVVDPCDLQRPTST